MATSVDFKRAFMQMFHLKELGLWWTQPRTSIGSSFKKDKFVLHMEIDMCDEAKISTIESYFNNHKVGIDNCFWGIPMQFVPIFRQDLDDDDKERIDKHARKQQILGNALKSVTVHGIQVNNWTSKQHRHTLFRQLMMVESLYDKQLVSSSKSKATFKGRLFYAIIPHLKSNKATFYYTAANYGEGRSVARGLPRFIKSYFGLDPKFYCSSEFVASAKQGNWSHSRRSFLTADEKMEAKKLDVLEDMVTATKPVFISKDHQRALAMNAADDASMDSKLTKGDQSAPPATDGSISSMSDNTGSTRQSKVQAAVKEVSKQYAETIADLQRKLAAAMQQQAPASQNATNDKDAIVATPTRPTQQLEQINNNGDDSSLSSSSNSTQDNNMKMSPHTGVHSNTFVIHSDSSFDPDNRSTIEISSSSSSSSSEVEFGMLTSNAECITPSPFRKGYNSKSGLNPSTSLNSNSPAVDHRPKRQLIHPEVIGNEDPPPGTAGGGTAS